MPTGAIPGSRPLQVIAGSTGHGARPQGVVFPPSVASRNLDPPSRTRTGGQGPDPTAPNQIPATPWGHPEVIAGACAPHMSTSRATSPRDGSGQAKRCVGEETTPMRRWVGRSASRAPLVCQSMRAKTPPPPNLIQGFLHTPSPLLLPPSTKGCASPHPRRLPSRTGPYYYNRGLIAPDTLSSRLPYGRCRTRLYWNRGTLYYRIFRSSGLRAQHPSSSTSLSFFLSLPLSRSALRHYCYRILSLTHMAGLVRAREQAV